MNGFTFSPALGWVAGGLLAAGLAVLAILEIALFVRRRAFSDETVWACIRRTPVSYTHLDVYKRQIQRSLTQASTVYADAEIQASRLFAS